MESMDLDDSSANADSFNLNDIDFDFTELNLANSKLFGSVPFSCSNRSDISDLKSLKKVLKLKKLSKQLTLKLKKLKQRQSYFKQFANELMKSMKYIFKSLESPLIRRIKVINSFKSQIKNIQLHVYRNSDHSQTLYYHLLQEIPKSFQDEQDFELIDIEPIKHSIISALKLPRSIDTFSLLHKSGLDSINSTVSFPPSLSTSSTRSKLEKIQSNIDKLRQKLKGIQHRESSDTGLDAVFLKLSALPDNTVYNSPIISRDIKQVLYRDQNYIIGRDLSQPISGYMLQPHSKNILGYDLSPNNYYLIINYGDILLLWNTRKKCIWCKVYLRDMNVFFIKFSSDEKQFVTSSIDGDIAIWSISQKKMISRLHSGSRHDIRYFYLSHNSEFCITLDHNASVWNLQKNRIQCRIEPKYGYINLITMTDCNKYIIYSTNWELIVLNFKTQNNVARFKVDKFIYHIEAIKNRQVIYSYENEIWIYDIKTQICKKIKESKMIGLMSDSRDRKLRIAGGRFVCALHIL
jgi:WD40 repeat protein